MGIVQNIVNLFSGYNWLIIPAALLTIVFHEVSHGWVAYMLGDRTAKDAGRLTLNPIKHMDIIGLLSMVIFGFGWAKPVPVNPYYFKNRKGGMSIVALAGPLSNILFALVALVGLRLLMLINFTSENLAFQVAYFFSQFFQILAILNVGLAVFNIIPIPPLDGSKILNALLPDRIYNKILQYEQFGFLVLIVLLNIPQFNWLIMTLREFVFSGLRAIVGV
ncbi:MAG: site-2 protease family protein [Clostridia bacterium]